MWLLQKPQHFFYFSKNSMVSKTFWMKSNEFKMRNSRTNITYGFLWEKNYFIRKLKMLKNITSLWCKRTHRTDSLKMCAFQKFLKLFDTSFELSVEFQTICKELKKKNPIQNNFAPAVDLQILAIVWEVSLSLSNVKTDSGLKWFPNLFKAYFKTETEKE